MAATTQTTPEVYREFIVAVDQLVLSGEKLHSRVAGLLYTGLLFAAQGTKESRDSGMSSTPGP